MSAPFTSKNLVNPESGTYFALRDISVLTNVQPDPDPIFVTMPDGSVRKSTHIASINAPAIPPNARGVRIIEGFVGSLLSIGVLCDSGLTATYDAKCATIQNGPSIIFTGSRDHATGLWAVNLVSAAICHSPQSCAVVPTPTATLAEVVSFYHRCFGSPALPTFTHAISKGYIRLPGLTASMIRKHPPSAIATAKGHLRQRKSGLQSGAERVLR